MFWGSRSRVSRAKSAGSLAGLEEEEEDGMQKFLMNQANLGLDDNDKGKTTKVNTIDESTISRSCNKTSARIIGNLKSGYLE